MYLDIFLSFHIFARFFTEFLFKSFASARPSPSRKKGGGGGKRGPDPGGIGLGPRSLIGGSGPMALGPRPGRGHAPFGWLFTIDRLGLSKVGLEPPMAVRLFITKRVSIGTQNLMKIMDVFHT